MKYVFDIVAKTASLTDVKIEADSEKEAREKIKDQFKLGDHFKVTLKKVEDEDS